MKEHCVICNKETVYDFDTHIDLRVGYVEGVGQLCYSCYKGNSETTDICVPNKLVLSTPNDQELGNKIRRLLFEKKKQFL